MLTDLSGRRQFFGYICKYMYFFLQSRVLSQDNTFDQIFNFHLNLKSARVNLLGPKI